ncbi:MAG: response regulator [Oscillospiraceae bacterium]|jgi:YesN/AraC family two-component response regulator|nr:response regulator [Oscillospiraceae bacterium]
MFKVLITDDEETIVRGIKSLVPWERYGCVVAGEAYDGISGMAQVRAINPDILFCDIRMPGMDGLSMLAGLRSEYPAMQTTIITGYREFEYARKAISLGVCRYLLKPSKIEEIEEALQAMTVKLKENAGETEDSPPAVDSLVVRSALSYLKQHCTEKLSLQDVADHVYVSQWHLSKLLKKHTGENFLDLLQNCRVDLAKQLLKNPALRVSDVAEKTGFSDATHFSKVFKKVTGQSALAFRNTPGQEGR